MSRDDLLLHAPAERSSSGVDLERVMRQVRLGLGLCRKHETQPVRVDRYCIIRRIGRGSFGEVFLAHDERLSRSVTLKLVRPDPEQPPDRMIARVHREAEVLARMSHPNIVHAYDVGEHEDGVFIVMEHIEGQNLEAWHEQRARTWHEILVVFLEAGRALQAAHGLGIVHKDFKPSNVLVDEKPPHRVRVIDWGLARDGSGARGATDDEGETAPVKLPTETIGFTPKYAAPEQMLGQPVSAKADQFAFCVALFEALFGEPPFVGRTCDELLARKRAGHVVPYARGQVPARIEAAIRRGLSPLADDRFTDMGELLEVLSPSHAPLPRAVGMAIVVGVALGCILTPTVPPCPGMRAHAGEIWNDGARIELARAFHRLELPYAQSAFVELAEDLDDYLDEWKQEITDTCRELGKASGASVEMYDAREARIDCLERRLETVGELLRQLGQPTVELVTRAPSLVEELPTPADCRRSSPRPTTAPPEAVRDLELGLGKVDALLVTHDWPQALETAKIVHQQAYAHHIERYEIEADMALGRAQVRTGAVSDGVRRLEDAGNRAERISDDVLAWNIWINLARDGRFGSCSSDDLHEWLAKAESAARHLDDEHRLMILRFERIEAELVELEQRQQELEALLAWAQDNDRELARKSAAGLTELLLTSDPLRATTVATQAVELAEEQLGPQHPLTVDARIDLAQSQLQSCRWSEAEAALPPVEDGLMSQPSAPPQELLLAQMSIAEHADDEARREAELSAW